MRIEFLLKCLRFGTTAPRRGSASSFDRRTTPWGGRSLATERGDSAALLRPGGGVGGRSPVYRVRNVAARSSTSVSMGSR